MGLDLEQLGEIMCSSIDPNALRDAWTGLAQISVSMREPFQKYVLLANKGARELGYFVPLKNWLDEQNRGEAGGVVARSFYLFLSCPVIARDTNNPVLLARLAQGLSPGRRKETTSERIIRR